MNPNFVDGPSKSQTYRFPIYLFHQVFPILFYIKRGIITYGSNSKMFHKLWIGLKVFDESKQLCRILHDKLMNISVSQAKKYEKLLIFKYQKTCGELSTPATMI